MDALAGERVEHDGERRGQRLALAGAHLGDRAAVQDHAADQLDVEVAHAHRAPAGLAHEREALGQQVVERLGALAARALAQLVDALAQLLVGLELELGLERVDRARRAARRPELLALADVAARDRSATCGLA